MSAAIVLKIRNQQHWVSNYHRHRMADMIDGMWTIHGLAKELGLDRDWFYRRIRSGLLREPNVIRIPPYGNYLIRNDLTLIEQLRREAQELFQARPQSQS